MNKKIWTAILPLLLLGPALGAQENPKAETPRKPLIPLKLQVVFSRYLGEKKVSSLPYSLTVNADGRPARLRMGIQVPVQTMANNTPTVQFKDAANKVDCAAEAMEDGRFKLSCQVEQTSLYSAEGARPFAPAATDPGAVNNTPLLRTFQSEVELLLRDGQTNQFTAATDPVSGELLKIEMTLNVIK